MEIVGVPFADYDWITHVVFGFAPHTSHQMTCQPLDCYRFRISRHEPNPNNLSFRSLDAVAANVWHRQLTRILRIRRRTGYGLVHLIGTERSCLYFHAPRFQKSGLIR